VRIPAGWDSWGKISVLREGFDPARIGKAWELSLAKLKDPSEDGEGLENIWEATIPIPDRGPQVVAHLYHSGSPTDVIDKRRQDNHNHV